MLFTVCAVMLPSCSDSNDGDSGNGDKDYTETVKSVLPTKTNNMNVYVHFMPWFETSSSSLDGKWGWHWIMNTSIDPSTGDVASHYHPLTGPYASGDETILKYQCLLMKYSGVDGVMVDWYGSDADNTTARHTSNTEALFSIIEKTGLKIAIVYEDQTLSKVSDPVAKGREDMRYLATHFFQSDNYAKVRGKPLLLVFGPQAVKTPKQWFRIFQALTDRPAFVVLNGHSSLVNDESYSNSMGEYLWVNASSDSWYRWAKDNFDFVIGGAMPGFKDYYKEGNAGDGYASYDDEGGSLFDRQLRAAGDAGLQWLQVSTWNDYGEGTIIEPTAEFGYRYLSKLQAFTGVGYKESDLQLIYRWYTLMVKHASDPSALKTLNECFNLLNTLQPDKASQLMDNL